MIQAPGVSQLLDAFLLITHYLLYINYIKNELLLGIFNFTLSTKFFNFLCNHFFYSLLNY
jgi:hypothetical protein